MAAADYIKPAFAPNFRAGWDALPEESEMVDDYGIGQRDSLQVGRGWLLGQGAVGRAVVEGARGCVAAGWGSALVGPGW